MLKFLGQLFSSDKYRSFSKLKEFEGNTEYVNRLWKIFNKERIKNKLEPINPLDFNVLWIEFLRYCWMVKTNKNEMVYMPQGLLDDLWHCFLLDSKEYEKFCHRVLGRYLHHHPEEGNNVPEINYLSTLELYVDTFKKEPNHKIWHTKNFLEMKGKSLEKKINSLYPIKSVSAGYSTPSTQSKNNQTENGGDVGIIAVAMISSDSCSSSSSDRSSSSCSSCSSCGGS